jgi:hypothetical protein
MAFHPENVPSPHRRRQWENQPSTRKKSIEPQSPWMSRSSIHEDRIGRSRIVLSSIGLDYLDMREMYQVALSTGSKVGVNLDSSHTPAGSDHLCENRRIVACAAADMNNVLSWLQVQRINQERDKAREAVIQPACRVEYHRDVAIQVA